MTEPPDTGTVQGLHPQPPVRRHEIVADRYHPVRVRAQFGYIVLALLALVIAFMALQTARGYLETREFVEIVFPAIVASAGTALGFYFRDQAEVT